MSPSRDLDPQQSTPVHRPPHRRHHSTSLFYPSPLASSSAGLSFAGLPDSPSSPVAFRTSYFDSPGGLLSSSDPSVPSPSHSRGASFLFPQRHRSYHGASATSPLSTTTPLRHPQGPIDVISSSSPSTPPPREPTPELLNNSVRSTRSTRSALSTRSGDLSDSPLEDPPRSPTFSDRSSAQPTPILVRPGRLSSVPLGRMPVSQPSTPIPAQRKASKGILFMPGKGRPTASPYTGGTPSGGRATVAISTAVATASPTTSRSISPVDIHDKGNSKPKHRRASSGASMTSFVSASSSLRASSLPKPGSGKGVRTTTARSSFSSDVPFTPKPTGALGGVQQASAAGSFGVGTRVATEALENATGGVRRSSALPSPDKIEEDRMSELSSVLSSLHVMDEPTAIAVVDSVSVTSCSNEYNTARSTPSSDPRTVKSSSMEEVPSDMEPELCEVDETIHEVITDGYGNGYIEVVADTDEYHPPYQPRASHFASMAAHVPQVWAITLSASIGPTDLPLNRRRIELDILWAPPTGLWVYVPFARFIPSWKLRLASPSSGKTTKAICADVKGKGKATEGDDKTLVVPETHTSSVGRELARAIISRLPILNRFATWV